MVFYIALVLALFFSMLLCFCRKNIWVTCCTLIEDTVKLICWSYGIEYALACGLIIGLIEAIYKRDVFRIPIHVLSAIHIQYGLWTVVHFTLNAFDFQFAVMDIIYNFSNTFIKPGSMRDDAEVVEPSALRRGDPLAKKKNQYLYGIGSGGFRPVVCGDNYNNSMAALNARIVAETPKPNRQYVRKCCAFVKRNMNDIFGMRRVIKSVTFDYYLKHSNASASVKRTLKRVKAQLDVEGITEWSQLTPEQLHKFTTRKSFVKVEHLCLRTPAGRKMKAPRLIQGAPAEFICLVGPWVMAYQSVIKKCWSKTNNMCFTSGVNSLDACKVINKPGYTILEDDVSAWDASVDVQWLELELWIMSWFGCPPAVRALIKANINTRGVTSHRVKYKRKGMRKSGDPYTSVGNSVLNGVIHLFIYCDSTGCSVLRSKELLYMLIQGDDSLIVYLPTIFIDWVGCMLKCGFNSEAIYRDQIYKAEFCSNLFYETSLGLMMAPKPGKVISKLGYFISPPRNILPQAIVRGTALGLYNACNHIPPLKAYLDRILQLTSGHKAYYLNEFADWKLKYTLAESVPSTQVTLIHRYEWTDAMQASFEKSLVKCQLGKEYNEPLFDLLCDRDSSGPSSVWLAPVAA
jgi:hypothetical protein